MKTAAIVIFAVVMIAVLVPRYLATRRTSLLLFAAFWVLVAAAGVTGVEWLIVPAAAVLGVGLYLQFASRKALEPQ